MGNNWNNVGEETSKTCMGSVGVLPDGTVFPVRCKKWSCPVCAPINALHWAIKVANGMSALYCAGVKLSFATLTQPASVKTPEYAYKILAEQWDGFRNRWHYWAEKQRQRVEWRYSPVFSALAPNLFTDDLPLVYAAFVEGQERRQGMPHFHIIGYPMPDKETMRKWAVSSGLGYQVDLQPIKHGTATAWYVSKYSTKSTDAQYMPDGFRRVRTSENWPDMLFKSDIQESTAIVKLPQESYTDWAIRAWANFGLDNKELLLQAQYIADNAIQQEYAEALAMLQMA